MTVNERNGQLVASFPVEDGDQIMLVTDKGQLIRVPVGGISLVGRSTQGVTIFNTAEDEKVVSVEHIREDENDEDEVGEDEDDEDGEDQQGEGDPEAFGMNPETLAAFVAATALLALSPGPAMSLIIANSASHGVRAGLLTILGNSLGLVLLAAAVVFRHGLDHHHRCGMVRLDQMAGGGLFGLARRDAASPRHKGPEPGFGPAAIGAGVMWARGWPFPFQIRK